MGKSRVQRSLSRVETQTNSTLVQRRKTQMAVLQVVVWSWLPISLAAVAAQSQGSDIGTIGQFIVPGSAAASIIACVWLFLQRMKIAGEEQSANIKSILDSHSQSIALLANRLDENTESIREMNRWIRECVQNKPKDRNLGDQ